MSFMIQNEEQLDKLLKYLRENQYSYTVEPTKAGTIIRVEVGAWTKCSR